MNTILSSAVTCEYSLPSLFRREKSVGIAACSTVGNRKTVVREAGTFPKRQMFIEKPPEPVPFTLPRPFGGTPKLRWKN